MSSYKVFKHPEKGFEAVKSGFAWLAPFNPFGLYLEVYGDYFLHIYFSS